MKIQDSIALYLKQYSELTDNASIVERAIPLEAIINEITIHLQVMQNFETKKINTMIHALQINFPAIKSQHIKVVDNRILIDTSCGIDTIIIEQFLQDLTNNKL